MPDQSTTKTARISLASATQSTFQGPKFRVLRELEYTTVYYDANTYILRSVGDTGVILYIRGHHYSAHFDVVSESESQILYHKDNLMVTVTEQKDKEATALFYTIIADVFKPINNLYVNTESKS